MTDDRTLFKKYYVIDEIGQGSYGCLFEVKPLSAIKKQKTFALKVEPISSQSNLLTEATVLKTMKGKKGFPVFKDYLKNSYFSGLVMTQFDKNLTQLQTELGGFSFSTVAQIGIQVLDSLQSLHKKGLVHLDIKPDNLMIGLGKDAKKISIVDFGFCQPFKIGNEHIAYQKTGVIRGTPKYMSLNLHHRYAPTRRDDIESLAYTLVQLTAGTLPWSNVEIPEGKCKFKIVKEAKESSSPELICKGLPVEFLNFLKYARNLSFSEAPDYSFLKKLLKPLVKTKKMDWECYEPTVPRKLCSLDNFDDFEESEEENADNETGYDLISKLKLINVTNEELKNGGFEDLYTDNYIL